jgi:hypothetical protein
MLAEQDQNPIKDARRVPTQAEGAALAQRMWKLLGSKTRHADQLDDWMDRAYDCWESSGLSWEYFWKVVEWALTENEFTVENLRIARNPGQSLFDKQWENITLFYDAAMAKKMAILRKKGKSVCPDCEMAEGNLNNEFNRCAECDAKWKAEYKRIAAMVADLNEKKLVRRYPKTETEAASWRVYWNPGYDPKTEPALMGWFDNWSSQTKELRTDHVIRTLLKEPEMLERLEEVYALNKGTETNV